jgi:hypothetical protein
VGIRLARHVACTGQGRNKHRVSVGKPEGKRPLVRRRRRWKDGIKLDLREINWEGFKCKLSIGTVGGLS